MVCGGCSCVLAQAEKTGASEHAVVAVVAPAIASPNSKNPDQTDQQASSPLPSSQESFWLRGLSDALDVQPARNEDMCDEDSAKTAMSEDNGVKNDAHTEQVHDHENLQADSCTVQNIGANTHAADILHATQSTDEAQTASVTKTKSETCTEHAPPATDVRPSAPETEMPEITQKDRIPTLEEEQHATQSTDQAQTASVTKIKSEMCTEDAPPATDVKPSAPKTDVPETTQKDRIPTLDGPALDPGSEMHVVGKLLDFLICFGSFREGFLCFF